MWCSLRRLGVLLIFLLVCGLGIDTGGLASAATPGPEMMVIRIGALLDQTGGSTSPLYRAAVELAASQMNQALTKMGSRLAFEIGFGDTKSSPPLAQTEAIRLINQGGVKALVTASSGETVNVNKLNYDPASAAKQKIPITCFQCSSGFINNPTVVDPTPSRKPPSGISTTGCSGCSTSRTTKQRCRCNSRSRTRRGMAPSR